VYYIGSVVSGYNRILSTRCIGKGESDQNCEAQGVSRGYTIIQAVKSSKIRSTRLNMLRRVGLN
jgi:hypothetical protein